jgi:hypothetical protein
VPGQPQRQSAECLVGFAAGCIPRMDRGGLSFNGSEVATRSRPGQGTGGSQAGDVVYRVVQQLGAQWGNEFSRHTAARPRGFGHGLDHW